ncbi:MAG: oligosaccharide flippase family protein, partial [Clostridium sp.]
MLVVMQAATFLIPLVTFPYLTRVLGVEQFGIYAYILILSQYLVLITDFGFNLSATKNIAQANGDKDLISKIFWTTLLSKVLIGLCCSVVVLFIYIFTVDNPAYQGIIYVLLSILASVVAPVWFFQGIEKISALTTVNILSRASAIPLVLLFVKSGNDTDIAILIS